MSTATSSFDPTPHSREAPAGVASPSVYSDTATKSIAGLKYASMSVHTRETAFKQSLLFANDRMVPRGIERLDGECLVLMCCHATDVRLKRALVESNV